MGKLFKAGVFVFAIIGLLMTAGVGYVYATNAELVGEFWSVKDDFKQVPDERRSEVVAELPTRITFEREVAEDMSVLPPERQTELYQQLANSREQVFEQFKGRISAEAKIVRETEKVGAGVKDVARRIETELGKVNVGVSLGDKNSDSKRSDPLAGVEDARNGVTSARTAYGKSRESGNMDARIHAGVNVLKALDKLGDEITKAKQDDLNSSDKRRLSNIVTDAKATLFDIKYTPQLDSDPTAKKLLKSVPPKLSSN